VYWQRQASLKRVHYALLALLAWCKASCNIVALLMLPAQLTTHKAQLPTGVWPASVHQSFGPLNLA